jgi:hypothetical protein
MRLLYLFLFLMVLMKLNAQTITQSFNEPIIGDVDKNYKLDTSAYSAGLPIGVTGSTAVWNFTQLSGIFPFVIDSFISPSGAQGSADYSGATFTQHRDDVFSFFKSVTSPQQTELMGAWSPSLSITFTNTAIIATYPVNYGYYLNDPVSGGFKYNSNTGACNGSITISADGLGTVNFPNNVSFQNVLRLKSVEQLTMTIGIVPVGSIRQTFYSYYAPGKKFPIISVYYTKYQLLAGQPTITAVCYGNPNYFSLAGINETFTGQNMQVFPNPFHDHLDINTGTPWEENECRLYDLNGRLALKVNNVAYIETQNLAPGPYFLQVRNRSGTFHQKIIKE